MDRGIELQSPTPPCSSEPVRDGDVSVTSFELKDRYREQARSYREAVF
jgi:hypothetical protein